MLSSLSSGPLMKKGGSGEAGGERRDPISAVTVKILQDIFVGLG